ncbi:MAG: GNAT family N-acetyltransferase [Elusimicrobiota bacterium]
MEFVRSGQTARRFEFVCFRNGRRTGWVRARRAGRDGETARLEAFGVEPEGRARGLSKANAWSRLAAELPDILRRGGFLRAEANVPADDILLVRLLLKSGTRVSGYEHRVGPFAVDGNKTRFLPGRLLAWLFRRRGGLGRWFDALWPHAWLLEGAAPGSSEPLRVLLLGRPEPFRYFALRAFSQERAPRRLGRRFLGSWKTLMAAHQADMLYADLPASLARRLSARLGHCLPELVEGSLDLRDKEAAARHRIFREAAQRAQENGWTARTARDLDAFYRFYYFHYLPTVGRKFAGYRHVLGLEDMRKLFQAGCLVELREGEEVLGAILAMEKKGVFHLAYCGVRGGSEELSKSGVLAGCYHACVRLAMEKGLKDVDFGPCHPFLDDGVFLHKRKWGVGFSQNPRAHGTYWFVPDFARPQARRFLLRAPFLAADGSGLSCVSYYESPGQDRRRWAAACEKHFAAPGVGRFLFYPLASQSRPSLGPRPPALWPSVSGPLLRSAARFRALLQGRDEAARRRAPWMPPRELRRLREEKLSRLLLRAKNTAPAFGALPDFRPPPDFSWEQFRRLPLMDRSDMALRPEAYRCEPRPPVSVRVSSSGTTGHPVVFWVDGKSIAEREAVLWRGREAWGLLRGDPYVKIWGRLAPLNRRRRFIELGLENAAVFNSYKVGPAMAEECRRRLAAGAFRYVYGYASAVLETAQFWLERRWALPPGRLACAFVTADTISASQEKVIEQAFGCPVAQEYGSSEFNEIALECPQGSLHINADRLLVEFLRDDGRPARAFERARIVVTDLDNAATPFIRYPVGDLGSYSDKPCPCGRAFPVLHELTGREHAFLHLPGGGRAHSVCLSDAVEDAHAARGLPCLPWLAVQREPESVEITLSDKSRSAALEAAVRENIRSVDPRLETIFRYAESVPRTSGGKRARFLSELGGASPAPRPAEMPRQEVSA